MSRNIKDILMNKTDSVESQRKEMFESLMDAVEKAGGNKQIFWDYVVYQDITVLELIDKLGQNNVRFVYVEKE